jgi:hypothetical protein
MVPDAFLFHRKATGIALRNFTPNPVPRPARQKRFFTIWKELSTLTSNKSGYGNSGRLNSDVKPQAACQGTLDSGTFM